MLVIEDRDYMRDPAERPGLSATHWLLVVNVAVFVPLYFTAYAAPDHFNRLLTWLALTPQALFHGCVWQLVTYQFLHGGVIHLLLNGLGIYVFGRILERQLGKPAFLKLYFASGVAGGLLQATLGMLLPNLLGNSPVVGASAAVLGLLAAFSTLYPNQSLTVLVIFIPVTMKAKYLLYISLAMAVMGVVFSYGDIAHGAHLGGLLAGVAYVRFLVLNPIDWQKWKPSFKARRPKELVKATQSKIIRWPGPEQGSGPAEFSRPDPVASDYISREVDPILDKISARGIQSLTKEERIILENAGRKMKLP
jgi:membrane associated rhomboid family serine protease